MKRKSGFTRIVTTALTAALLVTGAFSGTATKVFASSEGVVDTSLLNLRSGASTSTAVLALLRRGTELEIVATEGEWYKVTVSVNGSSKSGYVHSSYVVLNDDQDQSGTSAIEGKGVVNTKALNVRNAASYSGSVIGVVGLGTQVELLTLDGEWYKVNITLNGGVKTAYVHKDYITVTEDNVGSSDQTDTDTESSTDSADTAVTSKGTVNTSYGLNVRSQASTSSGILGVLANKTVVEIIGESNGWYKVNVTIKGKAVTGYVSAQYVVKNTDQSTNTDSSSDTEKPVTDGYTKGIVKAGLNLRTAPNTGSKVVTVLRLGSVVNIEAETGSDSDLWYKVTATSNGKEVSGYVCAKYVRKVSDAEAESGVIEVNASEEDEYLLACLIHVEATNQCYEGQLAVANVVLNRVKSPRWPDTIYDVIYQKGQFTPAHNGRLAKALANGPSENAKKAAADALAGINNVEGYYFFNANGGINLSTVGGYLIIQDHTFYYY